MEKLSYTEGFELTWCQEKNIIGIIIAIIVVPLAVYTISPLFVSTEVNEPLPVLASAEFQRFMNLTDDGRIKAAGNMSKQEKDSIMIMAAIWLTI